MRRFEHSEAISILTRTPQILDAWFRNYPTDWIMCNEGGDSWSPFDVVGHLIHGEKTDWIPRTKIILNHGKDRSFDSFDRFAQFEASQNKTMNDLLTEFEHLRMLNIEELKTLVTSPEQYKLKGMHPELGEVELGQLLSEWVVHDHLHIAQMARVMAKVWKDEVGVWKNYMPILGT